MLNDALLMHSDLQHYKITEAIEVITCNNHAIIFFILTYYYGSFRTLWFCKAKGFSMKLKMTLMVSILLSLSAQAAQELTPEKAAELQPFDHTNISGHFNSMIDVSTAMSQRADELGADYFYIQHSVITNRSGGNIRVTAALYKKDALQEKSTHEDRIINGVKELSKQEAYALQPYDTVSVRGFYRNQPDVIYAITQQAKKKDADSFFIVRQIDINNGGNQSITAFIYKKDAPKRIVQSPDKIPAGSQAAKAAIAAGGATATKVEIPGVASSDSLSNNVGLFWQTQSSTVQRYTVITKDGKKIQELNNATAAQMVPFDSITFTGHFSSMTDMSEQVAKRAADKGAKYYHITRQWQNKSGGNLTVSADLFK